MVINAVWTEDDLEGERHVAWARDFFSAMRPHAGGRVYINFLGDEGVDRVRQAYGDRQYQRLAELKRAYDPTNFFRLNQNIEP
jgi:FAD/FMN-containing dehydrogenase